MLNFPIYNYPTNAETDPSVLYRGLGSFWTQIFREKGVIKGYTTAMAEEIIQRYYDLLEAVNGYSVNNVPVFHKEKWKPIIIYKSKFGNVPFVFEEDSAVFGPQASTDLYYRNVVFQFGFPKKPAADVYLYDVGKDFTDFGVIADKIFSPSVFFIKGTDMVLIDGVLYFNRNIFDDPTLVKTNVISENGQPVQYTDANGTVYNEQFIILWAYHAELDRDILFNSFGYLFNLRLKNDQFFKDILGRIFDLYVDGPTVNNIKAICASFIGVTPVIDAEEEVVEVFNDGKYKFVITDKNVYKFETFQTILAKVKPGAIVYAGDILVNAIEYYDNISAPGWWKGSGIVNDKTALSQFLFLGDYKSQFVVSNSLDVVTLDANGDIVFPIEGIPSDVHLFHEQLNLSKETIKPLLGLEQPGDSVPIQPLDWLMENFLKNNTAFLRFRFSSNLLQSQFLSLLPILKSQLPPYIYLIFALELVMANEVYDQLNNSTPIVFDSGTETLNADGSNSVGMIEDLAPYGYKNARDRLFELSLGIPIQTYEIVATSADVITSSGTSSTYSVVPTSTSSVTLAAANTNRKGLIVVNDAPYECYLRFGGAASSTNYSIRIDSGTTYTMPPDYSTAALNAAWSGFFSGSALVTEVSSGTYLQMKSGGLLSEPAEGDTTRTFNKLLLLDFT